MQFSYLYHFVQNIQYLNGTSYIIPSSFLFHTISPINCVVLPAFTPEKIRGDQREGRRPTKAVCQALRDILIELDENSVTIQ